MRHVTEIIKVRRNVQFCDESHVKKKSEVSQIKTSRKCSVDAERWMALLKIGEEAKFKLLPSKQVEAKVSRKEAKISGTWAKMS